MTQTKLQSWTAALWPGILYVTPAIAWSQSPQQPQLRRPSLGIWWQRLDPQVAVMMAAGLAIAYAGIGCYAYRKGTLTWVRLLLAGLVTVILLLIPMVVETFMLP